MSRVGNRKLNLPPEVKFEVTDSALIFSKGEKIRKINYDPMVVKVKLENSILSFERANSSKFSNMMQGTLNSLSQGAITGLVKGFEKKLIIDGAGYKVTKKDSILVLSLGYSKDINLRIPKDIEMEISSSGKDVTLKSHNKEVLGEFAALIKKQRPVEPYKLKGVRIEGDIVIRKAGKSAEKSKK
ncbi:50S ribosomal protein L6 [Mycoplasma ovis str. Michigan]|uniref:50S ribosomal protein L6 n=1 Tax=Mycoplasma ovis str. Michigan TaxID=1415773 RepID=A0ABM5P0L9_9MOLU|nr:50S ribosomal protein L6 [Mycoplasma ovis]AHC39968.1 50S ribosomal protein L6 [Mycoplasma ovis str. Michigan]